MADSKPAEVLNFSNYLEFESETQKYEEVDSNMFLGTNDGIKYSLVQTSDGTLRLVEVLSDSNASLNSSKGSFVTSVKKEEDTIELQDEWVTPTNKPKLIKLMAVKSEPSPCKGQGDEIGNSVISPTYAISSFKESEKSELRKDNLSETLSYQEDRSSQLTYTTLLPKQQKREILINNPTPTSSNCNYSTPFTNSVLIRPPRYPKKPRIQFIQGPSSFSPIPITRVSAPRQKRPRQTIYHYTPQILHSTPNNLSSPALASDSHATLSGSSSGSQTSSNLSSTPTSFEYPRVPNNTPVSGEVDSGNQNIISIEWIPNIETGVENCARLSAKEMHNEKERQRRLRIKNACQCMRSLLPFLLSEKIDNASVFEQTVDLISFMKDTVGDAHDIEFLQQNHDYEQTFNKVQMF